MANPSYYQTGPVSQEVQEKEHLLHLYMYQRLEGSPDGNQKVIVNPNLPHSFGCLAVNDWAIYDGILPNANLVARAQGHHIGAGSSGESWTFLTNFVFVDKRFKESSLQVLGTIVQETPQIGEWAIIGGTGEFAFAQGIVSFKKIQELNRANIRELNIRAICRSFPKPTPVKVGPLGGKGGQAVDIPEPPKSLLSVTIRSGAVIDSIAFTYVDQAGKSQSAGPWGGSGGAAETILLAPNETVKKVSGTTGDFNGATVVTSLSIVTNVKTYGPFGNVNGSPFSIPEKDGGSVVGFFGSFGSLVDALGVYVA